MAANSEILLGDYVRFVVDAPSNDETVHSGIAGRGYVQNELGNLARIQIVAGEVEINYLPEQTFVPLQALSEIVIDKCWLTPLVGDEFKETMELHNAQLMMGTA